MSNDALAVAVSMVVVGMQCRREWHEWREWVMIRWSVAV